MLVGTQGFKSGSGGRIQGFRLGSGHRDTRI